MKAVVAFDDADLTCLKAGELAEVVSGGPYFNVGDVVLCVWVSDSDPENVDRYRIVNFRIPQTRFAPAPSIKVRILPPGSTVTLTVDRLPTDD